MNLLKHYLFLNFRKILYIFSLLLVFFISYFSFQVKNNIVYIGNKEIHHECKFQEVTGKHCPSCGNTRSLISFIHGDYTKSWNYNPIGFFIGSIFIIELLINFLILIRFVNFNLDIKYYSFVMIFIMLLSILRYIFINT